MELHPRRTILILLIASLLLVATCALGAMEFRAVSVGVTEAWTGNGYKPNPDNPTYDFQVTGSEATPIDPFLVLGARFSLVEGLFTETGSLSLAPSAQIGVRRYLLYENGRVVPTQTETALGDDENNEPGLGSARVLTVRLASPVSFELGLERGSSIVLGFSPTLLIRVRAGDIEVQTDRSDLSGMYGFFYRRMRFLMPEFHAAFRFPVSEFLQTSIFADYGVSVLDLFDTTLPAYDQMRVQVGVKFDLIPPFGGQFRDTEPEINLPEG